MGAIVGPHEQEMLGNGSENALRSDFDCPQLAFVLGAEIKEPSA
jgi:hypothetical protein